MPWRKAILDIWRHEETIIFQPKKVTERNCCGKFVPIRVRARHCSGKKYIFEEGVAKSLNLDDATPSFGLPLN